MAATYQLELAATEQAPPASPGECHESPSPTSRPDNLKAAWARGRRACQSHGCEPASIMSSKLAPSRTDSGRLGESPSHHGASECLSAGIVAQVASDSGRGTPRRPGPWPGPGPSP